MTRTLSLRTLLALGLVLALVAPAAAGTVAWLATTAWQADRVDARRAAAMRALELGMPATVAERDALGDQLSRLGVEADLAPDFKFLDAGTIARTKLAAGTQTTKPAIVDKAKLDGIQVRTPGLEALLRGPEGKQQIGENYASTNVNVPGITGTLFVRHESMAARWAVAAGAALAALAAALVLAVSLLRRWVLRPLARLAADADRIAGGELEVEPVMTRACEVAQVSDALGGMAGALGEALGASAAAERERRFLVTAIAHDLRTPLFTLRGSLEAIERGIGNGNALARAQDKAAHLDRLVGGLFAYSRAEYSREGTTEAVDLSEIARRAAGNITPGDVRLEVVTNGPVSLTGDPVALERVLTNLLDNAVRHARTHVELRVSGHSVEVADDGPGFAPEDLPHVFDPLFRGDRARASATGGAGLGLAIARRLARANDGEVEAANQPDGGALVTLTLP